MDNKKRIQKLPVNFTGVGEVKNVHFERVFENDKGYVYKCTSFGKTYYESFKKKIVAKCINFKNREYSTTDFKEVYPKSNDFGMWAWYNEDYLKALEKLN